MSEKDIDNHRLQVDKKCIYTPVTRLSAFSAGSFALWAAFRPSSSATALLRRTRLARRQNFSPEFFGFPSDRSILKKLDVNHNEEPLLIF